MSSTRQHCGHCPLAPGDPCPAERARGLCRKVDPADPQYGPEWRGALVEHARQQAEATRAPSLARQAANLAGAVGRAVAAVATGGPVLVPEDVHAERLASCMGCEHNGAAPAGVLCRKCGCGGAKLHLATESCPVGRWARWDGPRPDAAGPAGPADA